MTKPHTCETCGQPVEIMSSDEGTSYYRGLAGEAEAREKLTWMASAAKALAEVETLRDILESLVDLQNGCPLPKYHDQWNATMARAYQVLGRGEWEEMG